eukprot:6041107-Alexandrium_andersonii.AAC.1
MVTFASLQDRAAQRARGLRARCHCALHGSAPLFPACNWGLPLFGPGGYRLPVQEGCKCALPRAEPNRRPRALRLAQGERGRSEQLLHKHIFTMSMRCARKAASP